MVRTAQRLKGVEYSATIGLSDAIKKMRLEGRDVISLAAARPDFDTPSSIKEAAISALRQPHEYIVYTESRGLLELRQAVAEKLSQENGLELDPEREILITVGAREGLFLAMQALVNPGDDVLVIDPSWLTYQALVRMAGGNPVFVPLYAEDGYHLDPEVLRSRVTDRTRAVILNTPNNPTGAVSTPAELEAIRDLAVERDLVVVTDEIYEYFVYDGHRHVSPASLPGMAERTLTTNACSKAWAMTGWRIGFIAGPASLIDKLLLMHQHLVSAPCSFAQKGAVTAYTSARDTVRAMVDSYRRRRDQIAARLADCPGVDFSVPEGACFFFLSFPGLGLSSEELSEKFLELGGLALTPGSAFGSQGQGHLRLSFATIGEDQVDEVMDRFSAAARELGS